MKKHIKSVSQAGLKLKLNKRTISNLSTPEMTEIVGGKQTFYCFTDFHCTRGCGPTVGGPTQHGHTCNGNNC